MATSTAVDPANSQADDKIPAASGISKEVELAAEKSQFEQEKQLIETIVKRSDEIDKHLQEKVQGDITEARLSRPEPEISEDLDEVGLKAPLNDANDLLKKGTTIEIPYDEEKIEQGLHTRIVGKMVNNAVIGVSSLAGLAMWALRIIKIAHKRALQVIFRTN